MCFSGYRNDMFLVFDCNPVQYEFIYGMVQIVSVLIIYITFFYGDCTLKSLMLFTQDQRIFVYFMSAWSV